MQREEPVTNTRFVAAQFQESWSRSAAVRVGRQSTQTGYRTIRIHSCEAVIGPGDPAIDGRRVQLLGVRTSSPSASDCGCASAPRLAGATSWPER